MIIDHVEENFFTKRGIYFGWWVVGSTFLITTVTVGALYSYSIIFLPVSTEFGWGRGLLSWVPLITGCTYAIVVPFAGWLADRFGFKQVISVMALIFGLGFLLSSQIQSIWQLYVFMGVICGLGTPVALVLPLSLVAHWFVKRRGLAMGGATAGIGVGTALIPILVAYFITIYGWRITYGSLGILIWLVCIPLAFMTMRIPETKQTILDKKRPIVITKSGISREENSALSLSEALRTAPFWLLFCVFALCIWSLGMAMTHLVPFAQDTGLPAVTAAGLMTTIGICGIVGRVTSGFLSDRFGSRPILVLGIFVQCVMILLLLKADSVWIFYFFAICFGLSYGGNIVLIPKLTANIFGLNSMATIFGALSVADGIGFGAGSLMAGYIFDVTGSYNISFLTIAGGLAAAAFLTLILKEKPTK